MAPGTADQVKVGVVETPMAPFAGVKRVGAGRKDGGAGSTLISTDLVTLRPGSLSFTLTIMVQVMRFPGAVQVTGLGPEVAESVPQVADHE
jgi:hypothetical protein